MLRWIYVMCWLGINWVNLSTVVDCNILITISVYIFLKNVAIHLFWANSAPWPDALQIAWPLLQGYCFIPIRILAFIISKKYFHSNFSQNFRPKFYSSSNESNLLNHCILITILANFKIFSEIWNLAHGHIVTC